MAETPPEFYTAAEIMARMTVSKMTVYRMAHCGEIPGTVRFDPRMFRFHAATFDAWLAEQVRQVTK